MGIVNFLGKLLIEGKIKTITGLRIAGPTTGLKIGGLDQPVIFDAFGKPYIPGSSLKGKMRNLLERKLDLIENESIHQCKEKNKYEDCPVCKIWGILGNELKDENIVIITRLIVRDVPIDELSITEEMRRNMELTWTEVKMETAIDRIRGTALGKSLRTIDRVPAGAEFSPMEIIYNVFDDKDKEFLKYLFEAMALLEHDYLGGMGSRGYGKIKFKDLKIYWKYKESYENGVLNKNVIYEGNDISEIIKNFEEIKGKIQ